MHDFIFNMLIQPQGDNIPPEYVMALMQALAPVLCDAGAEPDKL